MHIELIFGMVFNGGQVTKIVQPAKPKGLRNFCVSSITHAYSHHKSYKI